MGTLSMSSSLETNLGEMFKVPDERILKAVEKANSRCLIDHRYVRHHPLLRCVVSVLHRCPWYCYPTSIVLVDDDGDMSWTGLYKHRSVILND